MKIQTITLQNALNHKLELQRIITPYQNDKVMYGKLFDNSLFGLSFDARRILQSIGMRCKYNNGTGFTVGKVIDIRNYKEVPNIYKQDTDKVSDLDVYTVIDMVTLDL